MIYIDQMGREVELEKVPQRIISLVPSQTELLFSMDLADHIVGRTKFCIHPEDKVKAVARVGGTKKYNFEKITELQPDLIIGNKEENEKVQIDELVRKYPVWMSDISNLDSALEMIRMLGQICDRVDRSNMIVNRIKKGFSELSRKPPIPVAYLIWHNPMMAAGTGTFINEMLTKGGFENVVATSRYPEVNSKELSSARCIMLSSEPYPFKDKHLEYFKSSFPEAIIKLVDGELFSWYGSRLLQTPSYLDTLYEETAKQLQH